MIAQQSDSCLHSEGDSSCVYKDVAHGYVRMVTVSNRSSWRAQVEV